MLLSTLLSFSASIAAPALAQVDSTDDVAGPLGNGGGYVGPARDGTATGPSSESTPNLENSWKTTAECARVEASRLWERVYRRSFNAELSQARTETENCRLIVEVVDPAGPAGNWIRIAFSLCANEAVEAAYRVPGTGAIARLVSQFGAPAFGRSSANGRASIALLTDENSASPNPLFDARTFGRTPFALNGGGEFLQCMRQGVR